MFFTSNIWCSLRLLQLKTAGQTIQTEHLTQKLQITEIKILTNPGLALSGFEQSGPESYEDVKHRGYEDLTA